MPLILQVPSPLFYWSEFDEIILLSHVKNFNTAFWDIYNVLVSVKYYCDSRELKSKLFVSTQSPDYYCIMLFVFCKSVGTL